MHKIQKTLPISSLIWAAIVTAIVLALAASARAQETDANATTANEPAVIQARPVPGAPKMMLKASSSPTRINEKRELGNASGTRPMNATSTEARAAMEMMRAEKLKAFEERRATLTEDMEARRIAITEKRALMASSTLARKAVLKEEAQTRIADRADKLTGVVNAAIGRLEAMSARLREHANKLRDRLVDVSGVIDTLDEADRQLVAAKAALTGVDTNISYATLSEKPQEDWMDAKEQFMAVRTILTDVRELLKEALSALKEVNKGSVVEPSTAVMPANQ